MNQDEFTNTTTIEARYGNHILSAHFVIVTDRQGKQIAEKSHAQLTLINLAALHFPLVWSTPATVKQAHAALNIFEKTGVTLQ